MVLQGKGHVLFDSQRVVKCGMLKQKTHFLPDLAEPVESQAGNVLPVDANRSRVRFLESDNEPEQHALAGTTAPQHRQGLAALHGQADPVQNLLTAERFMQVLDGDNRRAAVFLGFSLPYRDLIDCFHTYLVRSVE